MSLFSTTTEEFFFSKANRLVKCTGVRAWDEWQRTCRQVTSVSMILACPQKKMHFFCLSSPHLTSDMLSRPTNPRAHPLHRLCTGFFLLSGQRKHGTKERRRQKRYCAFSISAYKSGLRDAYLPQSCRCGSDSASLASRNASGTFLGTTSREISRVFVSAVMCDKRGGKCLSGRRRLGISNSTSSYPSPPPMTGPILFATRCEHEVFGGFFFASQLLLLGIQNSNSFPSFSQTLTHTALILFG